MKARLSNSIKRISYTFSLLMIILISAFLSGCTKEIKDNLIICNSDEYSIYSKVLQQTFPEFIVKESDNKAYYFLEDGSKSEAFNTQAVGALETKIAKYWYPHYLATVIIAVDRDHTSEEVSSWNDLLTNKGEVGFFDTSSNTEMLIAAMSYGLEGENYTSKKAIQLLSSLHKNNRLIINSFKTPFIICFDYQAAYLIENGRNLDIIIPKDGTFTYEKGLLSNENLNFKGNFNSLLLQANLRSLDGESDFKYPKDIEYKNAIRVPDYKHFAKITQNTRGQIERNVLNSKRFMSIDNLEHLYFALIYIIIVTIWTVSVLRRSMQKGISYAAFFTGFILNSWTLVRLVKYQIVINPTFTRYLWYSFYIFQLSLPLVLLWMAWAIDKPEKHTIPPKWWRYMAIFITFLIFLVFTNDLHGLVLNLDLSRIDWDVNYSYGLGYYLILFVCMGNLVAVFSILVQKSIRNPRKKGFILPLLIFILFGIYNYKYIIRDPFIYETDLTIITGIFAMLMFETSIRSGLIPVNTKYVDLFTRSPLKMQLINRGGEIALASAAVVPINKYTIDKVIESAPEPIIIGGNSLLFANSIPGGYALWEEDIGKIYELQNEIKKSTQLLIEANSILSEEEKIKRSINEKNAKKELIDQLETEIAESLSDLSTMIYELPDSVNKSEKTTSIALLLCYIKRRCNLFFREKETNIMDVNKLIGYLDELSEISNYCNVEVVTINDIKKNFNIRDATLFYDFFYEFIDLAVQICCTHVIVHLREEKDSITMALLTSDGLEFFKPKLRLAEAINRRSGNLIVKDLEDTVGIRLSFPKVGESFE